MIDACDTREFLYAVAGRTGPGAAERKKAKMRALSIVRKVVKRLLSPDEAIEEFFGRGSDDALLMCIFVLLPYKKVGTPLQDIMRAVAAWNMGVPQAISILIAYKRKHCDELKRAILKGD